MAAVVADLVTLFIASVTLATYVAICAHVLWRQHRCAGLVDPVRAVWANIRSRVAVFSAMACMGSEVDLVTVEVRKLFVRRRLQLVRGWLVKVAHVSAVYQMLILPGLFANLGFDTDYGAVALWMNICLLIFQALIFVSPKTLTPRTADAFVVVIMALYCVRLALDDDPYSVLAFMPVSALLRCGASLLITSVPTRILANAGFGTVTFVKCWSVYHGHFREDSEVMGDQNLLMGREASVTLFILITGYALDVNIWAAARATVMAKSSRRSEGMANLLLTSLCDAVVHLSDSLHICKPAPQLAALLLMRSQTPDLMRTDFLSLVEETDRHQFADVKATTKDSAAINIDGTDACDIHPAWRMNLHLLDSSGTRVSVQLLLATCLNLDDSINHIVGIREVGCEEGLPYPSRTSSRHPALQEPQNETNGSTSSDSTDTDSRSDVVWDGSPLGGAATHDNSEIIMIVDSRSKGCPILECTPLPRGFVVSSLVGSNLLDLIGNRQSFRLLNAIQTLANEVRGSWDSEVDDSGIGQEQELGVLSLRPFGRRRGLKYQASCTISVDVMREDSEDAHSDFVFVEMLTFKIIHCSNMPCPGRSGDVFSGHPNCGGSPCNTPIESLASLGSANSNRPGPLSMSL